MIIAGISSARILYCRIQTNFTLDRLDRAECQRILRAEEVQTANEENLMEVGGNEICNFYNFLSRFQLHYNSLFSKNFQFLFGFICFWKIRVF